jgi:alpha/beta superfamily hydrolase
MPKPPRRPPPEPRSNFGASMPLRDVDRLHAIAAERHVSLTKLVVDALRFTYPELRGEASGYDKGWGEVADYLQAAHRRGDKS